MGVDTIFPPASSRPASQYSNGANLGTVKTGFGPFYGTNIVLVRDNFKTPTWICLGCIIQYLLTLCFRPPLAALPALLLVAWSIFDTLLMAFGLKKNTWYDGVIDGRIAAAYPAEGRRTAIAKPANNGPGAIMILGSRSNHPLGIFAPGTSYVVTYTRYAYANKPIKGFREIGHRFRKMVAQLEKDQTAGFMGMSTWVSTERSASNEYATISYWRSIDDIHQFALSPVHRDAWTWWNDAIAKGGHKQLSIMHEIFEVPKQNGFEGIYVNYHQTGLAATTRLVKGGKEAGEEWVVPIVDATRGIFRTSRGRLGRDA